MGTRTVAGRGLSGNIEERKGSGGEKKPHEQVRNPGPRPPPTALPPLAQVSMGPPGRRGLEP